MRGAFLVVATSIVLLADRARADEPQPIAVSSSSQPAKKGTPPEAEQDDECPQAGYLCAPDDYDPHRKFEYFPSGHIAFAMGGAASPYSTFRMGLDASIGLVAANDYGGWTFAPSIVTGFGQYPSYASFDVGHVFLDGQGQFSALAGLIVTAGPALRFDPSQGVGAEFSARFYLIVLQLGVRAITIFTNGAEVQIQGTAGVGFM